MVKRGVRWQIVELPGSEDVGVFVGIVPLF